MYSNILQRHIPVPIRMQMLCHTNRVYRASSIERGLLHPVQRGYGRRFGVCGPFHWETQHFGQA